MEWLNLAARLACTEAELTKSSYLGAGVQQTLSWLLQSCLPTSC